MITELYDMKFKHSPYVPFDPSVTPLYSNYVSHAGLGGLQPFVYTDWRDEEMSWHENCYIHAGLNPMPMVWLKGKEALKFLSDTCTNGFEKFPIGRIKHGIITNTFGELMSDGIIYRLDEDEFLTTCMNSDILFKLQKSNYDLEYKDTTGEHCVYQLGGPKSLDILEAVTGENLRDIKFLQHRMSKINDMDVRILRIGMAGSLAYEVHGEYKNSISIYNAIVEAGKPMGITRLGRHAYWNTHTENGFPQNTIHFFGAIEHDKEYFEYLKGSPAAAMLCGSLASLTGSCGNNYEERFVNPFELGWDKAVNFDHDFPGKEALMKLKDNHRVMVTLEWNVDDILDIVRSGFEDGVPYAPMDGPEDMLENGKWEYRADKVMSGDKYVGISTGRIHSWFYRKMISLCVIDPAYSELGTELTIIWGNQDQRQKEIRAKVARYPYMNGERNENVDVTKK
ncbi:aminomethyl transferase family protein [Novisyntrophococcus fermenticellae]|uniref:aminomethyl transferase family protein n=1 Tax=Novisyntrophococcus fermenticellae TaxID=2068655 RepID=UPI001E37D4EA|nr:aminomethyl transferase family protein [Novisyntrophococcus fermenticellae]